MSQWATLEARFVGKYINAEYEMPKGSESGPTISTHDGAVYVDGRLRDVSDFDSPAVLAWFVQTCNDGLADEGDLLWDVDNGPRYRYEWRDGGLRKLRGILDA